MMRNDVPDFASSHFHSPLFVWPLTGLTLLAIVPLSLHRLEAGARPGLRARMTRRNWRSMLAAGLCASLLPACTNLLRPASMEEASGPEKITQQPQQSLAA